MLRRTLVLALAGGLLLSGCSLPKPDAEADKKARALYDQIRTGADLSKNPDLGAELKAPAAMVELAKVRTALPDGTPTSTAIRSWRVNIVNGETTAMVVHAYGYPSRTVLAETVLRKDAKKVWTIVGFHIAFADPGAPQQPPRPAVSVDPPKDI